MCVCVCAECCDENVNYPENATYTFKGTTRRTTAGTEAIEGKLHISEGEDCGEAWLLPQMAAAVN